jgi:hypothetical protein
MHTLHTYSREAALLNNAFLSTASAYNEYTIHSFFQLTANVHSPQMLACTQRRQPLHSPRKASDMITGIGLATESSVWSALGSEVGSSVPLVALSLPARLFVAAGRQVLSMVLVCSVLLHVLP